MQRAYIPALIARQPWGVVLPLLGLVLFGGMVLYSAAGGSLQPWAVTHVVRFGVFLAMALVIARMRPELFRFAAFPGYVIILVLLMLVEALGFVGG
ncbi:MAG: rod shape-determining protein RodA, partial [Novosphingobium sp.]|nr:rod shape-determining protein RodA [Novosphingobium sp.]